MHQRLFFLSAVLLYILSWASAQEPLKYQLPPDEILKIVDAPPTPGISISPDKTSIIIIDRPGLRTIEDLSAGELRIAGIRIDPANNGRSRQSYNTGYRIMNIDGTNARDIKGMPGDARLGSPVWSPDGKKFAFTNSRKEVIELWICNIETSTSMKIAGNINQVFENGFSWLSDNKSLVYYVTAPERGKKPERSNIPEGPVVQENIGKQGQARTYQDLLKDAEDELLFEYYGTSQLMLWDGEKAGRLGKQGMITGISPSPDGNYFLVEILDRPYSYAVPYYYFPRHTQIWDREGRMIRNLFSSPLMEDIPRAFDAVLPGPRSAGWRADKPATIYWVEALDEGNYENKTEFHDQVYCLDAPFDKDPSGYIATRMRYRGISWGKEDYAIIYEGLTKTRTERRSAFDPRDPRKTVSVIHEYNTDDRYGNPGSFMTTPNTYGRSVLLFGGKGKTLFLSGTGASAEGDRPFIDRYDIAGGKTERLWRSQAPYYESLYSDIDIIRNLVITSRQSVTEVPNYFIRNLRNGKLVQITDFKNPYPQLSGIYKELVRYKRKDGVDLSFTLYLPAGYSKERDGGLPTLLWAYPRDFNDPSTAGQVSGSPYTFTRISPESALVYLTQGYAVLMDATFPIVKTEGKEANDTFIEQLIANAEAAIDKAVELGVTDRKRVAVSGHSYGGFMTANLIANSRLFAAGIAESGAYNRTLTPFGFQNERRTYWEAPDLYNRMSPFMQADKVKDPIMLIHGTADNNDGTFPIQSERLYAALKGFGATVRLVLLPNESHGYSARESILHKHWEVLKWMDQYVKKRK